MALTDLCLSEKSGSYSASEKALSRAMQAARCSVLKLNCSVRTIPSVT